MHTHLKALLYALPAGVIAADIVWAISKDRSFVVLRSGTEVAIDDSFYFGSDSVAVRATVRIAFGWPHPAAIVKIQGGGS
jgi:hypothetical protein